MMEIKIIFFQLHNEGCRQHRSIVDEHIARWFSDAKQGERLNCIYSEYSL